MEFSRSTKIFLLKKAEDEGFAVETLSSVANEEFIGHTAHETVTAATRIQPQ